MNDTFSFVAPVMPRRTVDPFALRLAVTAGVIVALVGAFGAFVVQREHVADARRATLEATIAAQAAARAETMPDPREDPEILALLDSQARSSATRALELATSLVASTEDLAQADPAQLSLVQPSMLFVDGPSTSPAVVSVRATSASWSAAVMAPSGICYWVALDADRVATYDTGRACTGAAAAGATGSAW